MPEMPLKRASRTHFRCLSPRRIREPCKTPKTAGEAGVAAVTGAAGLARGAIAKTAVGAIAATSAAGKAPREVAKRGGSEGEQRIAALGAAAAEALGPKLTKIGAKEGKGLVQKYMGRDFSDMNPKEFEALNDFLASEGMKVLTNGAIRRFGPGKKQ